MSKKSSSRKKSTCKKSKISKNKENSLEEQNYNIEKIPKKEIRSKSISIAIDTYEKLLKIKEKLTQKLGGSINFNVVIQSLINDHLDLENVKKELIEMQNQAIETAEYLKNLLQLALEKSSITPQIIPLPQVTTASIINPSLEYTQTTTLIPPPPPPKPPLSPEEIELRKKRLQELENKNLELKEQFVKELHLVFDGTEKKPSEILKITKPLHEAGKIHKIDEDKNVPDIFSKSFVMQNLDKFKKDQETEEIKGETN